MSLFLFGKSFLHRCVRFSGHSGLLFGPGCAGLLSFVNVAIERHQHFQRRRAALPRSPVHPLERAQKDFLRPAALEPGLTFPVTGALRLLPVLRLILALPLAVRPPFLDLQPFLMPQPFMAPFFLAAIYHFSSEVALPMLRAVTAGRAS